MACMRGPDPLSRNMGRILFSGTNKTVSVLNVCIRLHFLKEPTKSTLNKLYERNQYVRLGLSPGHNCGHVFPKQLPGALSAQSPVADAEATNARWASSLPSGACTMVSSGQWVPRADCGVSRGYVFCREF